MGEATLKDLKNAMAIIGAARASVEMPSSARMPLATRRMCSAEAHVSVPR
jgi:hypothetical protein